MLKLLSLRNVAFLVVALVVTLVAAVWFFSDGRSGARAHDTAQDLWDEKEPTAYSFDYVYCSGMCERCDVHVTVRDGEVTDAVLENPDCTWYDPQRAPTIDEIFALEAEDRGAETTDSFEITYDPVFGFPASVEIRCPYGWADCGSSYAVTNFRVES